MTKSFDQIFRFLDFGLLITLWLTFDFCKICKYFREMFILLLSWKMPRWQTGIEESNTRISHGLSHETPTLVGYLIERITKERNCRFGQEEYSTTHWIYSHFKQYFLNTKFTKSLGTYCWRKFLHIFDLKLYLFDNWHWHEFSICFPPTFEFWHYFFSWFLPSKVSLDNTYGLLNILEF